MQTGSCRCQSKPLAHGGCRHPSVALPLGLPHILPLQSAHQGTAWLLVDKKTSQIHSISLVPPGFSALTCFQSERTIPPGRARQLGSSRTQNQPAASALGQGITRGQAATEIFKSDFNLLPIPSVRGHLQPLQRDPAGFWLLSRLQQYHPAWSLIAHFLCLVIFVHHYRSLSRGAEAWGKILTGPPQAVTGGVGQEGSFRHHWQ